VRPLTFRGHAILPDPPPAIRYRWDLIGGESGKLPYVVNERTAAKLREMGYGELADTLLVSRPLPARRRDG
jgi:hypothetical protein